MSNTIADKNGHVDEYVQSDLNKKLMKLKKQELADECEKAINAARLTTTEYHSLRVMLAAIVHNRFDGTLAVRERDVKRLPPDGEFILDDSTPDRIIIKFKRPSGLVDVEGNKI